MTDYEDGPVYGDIHTWNTDTRRAYCIAEDAETVVPMLEEAGWRHTPLPDAFSQEGLLKDNTFDRKLRDLAAENDHWWFYRDDYYVKYNEKNFSYTSYQYLSREYTYAVYFPDLNLLYYRRHDY